MAADKSIRSEAFDDDDDAACFITRDQLKGMLEEVEKRLAVELKLKVSACGSVRREILRRATQGKLPETELVERWDEYYSRLVAFRGLGRERRQR